MNAVAKEAPPRMHQDNVLVLMDWLKEQKEERRTPGGLIIPQTSQPDDRDAAMATVVAAGPGCYLDSWIDHERGTSSVGSPHFQPNELKPGMRVIVDRASQGDAYMLDGFEHRIIRQHNIIGIVEDDE